MYQDENSISSQIGEEKLTNLAVTEIKRGYNILFSGYHHTLSTGLLCVKHSVLHFAYVLLMPVLNKIKT